MSGISKTYGKTCAAINCYNNQGRNRNKSYFSFPLNPERCMQWVINIRREHLLKWDCRYLHANYRLCSDHFEEKYLNVKRNRLKENAVPTLFASNPPKCLEVKPLKKKKKKKRLSPDHVNTFQINTQEIPPVFLTRKPEVKLVPLQNSEVTSAPSYDSDTEIEDQIWDEEDSNQEQHQRTVQTQTVIEIEKESCDVKDSYQEQSQRTAQTHMDSEIEKQSCDVEDSNQEQPEITVKTQMDIEIEKQSCDVEDNNQEQPEVTVKTQMDIEIKEQSCDVEDSNQEQPQRNVQTETSLTKEEPLVEFTSPIVQDYNKKESQMVQEDNEIKELKTENKGLKNQVEYLRNKVTTLEAELLKIFNWDQLWWIQNPNSRGSIEWSEATLLKSSQLRYMIGPKGYNFLRHDLGFPLPSDTTVIKKAEKDGFDPSVCEELLLLCKKTGR